MLFEKRIFWANLAQILLQLGPFSMWPVFYYDTISCLFQIISAAKIFAQSQNSSQKRLFVTSATRLTTTNVQSLKDNHVDVIGSLLSQQKTNGMSAKLRFFESVNPRMSEPERRFRAINFKKFEESPGRPISSTIYGIGTPWMSNILDMYSFQR